MKDRHTQEQFIELRAQDWSFDRIAKELNVSKKTLISWSRDFQLEIRNLRALEIDTLQEKYALTRLNRLELFGEKFNSLKEEIKRRNLEDLSTEKLFDLLLKYGSMLKNEQVQVEFGKKENAIESQLNNVGKTLSKWEG